MRIPAGSRRHYMLLASRFVTRCWPWVILGWIAIAVFLRSIAPAWDMIAADGDLAFLPDSVASSIGQRALEEAFPGSGTRSQIVIVVANPTEPMTSGDVALALDVCRRLHWLAAQAAWQELSKPTPVSRVAGDIDLDPSRTIDSVLAEVVKDNLTEAIDIEDALSKYFAARGDDAEFQRLPNAYQIRGELLADLGETETAALDLDTAELMREGETAVIDAQLPSWFASLRDVWSWRNAVVGHKLQSEDQRAKLIAVQLGTDFAAIGNIEILNGIESLIEELRLKYADRLSPDLQIEATGSAAVGADMLRAAASGVKQTELVTLVLVVSILTLVYRAPFLVAIPLASIALSLLVSTSLIALLARDPTDPESFGLGVFTTTRIFIVVLLFGTGTDFCLFFLARCREVLQAKAISSRKKMHTLVAKGWRGTHDALVTSALTTIVGLGLMWFSRFEKFQFSGPVIAVSLAVTLLVCLTFTPALVCGIGRLAFWPHLRGEINQAEGERPQRQAFWSCVADLVVARPRPVLFTSLFILAMPAIFGISCLGRVTYDLTEELSANATSRSGAALLSRFFSTVESSPVTVLLTRKNPFDSEQSLRQACDELSESLYIDGVASVRSLTDPLGDYPPGKRMGLFDQDAWRRRMLLGHRITKERYVSSVDDLAQRVAKFDIILIDNAFSLEAGNVVERVREKLASETSRADSAWHAALVTASGTTVGIMDLREVTQSDQRRIQVLVTLGVWSVLVIMLRRFVLSSYLIFTVLLSYFATLGVTYIVFSWMYAQYSGLDWKVPLYLFVILVAVGQDYNVYLVTRIFEEQRKLGIREGVRSAITISGGIITSCGAVMAGTFGAMTSPAVSQWLSGFAWLGWLASDAPVLRGINELGFALAFGVLLDTLIVRSILVPAFVLLWQSRVPATDWRGPN